MCISFSREKAEDARNAWKEVRDRFPKKKMPEVVDYFHEVSLFIQATIDCALTDQ